MAVPVIIFAYNRLDLLRDTLSALEKNDLATETKVFVFSDGAKGDSDHHAVGEVQSFLLKWEKNTCFQEVQLFLKEENQGLASSVIAGVTKIMEQYDKVIVVEDDLVTSSDFLAYMNQALHHFEEDARVWSISGYVPELNVLDTYPHDVFLYPRACSWGWGTWKNRWEMVDWSVKDFSELARDKKKIQAFNRGGEDMFRMLMMQQQGKIDSWAIRWCYAQSKANKLCVYPTKSKVQNVGCRNGTHFHNEEDTRYDTHLHVNMCKWEPCLEDETILQEFRAIYQVSFADKIKRKVKSIKRKWGLH